MLFAGLMEFNQFVKGFRPFRIGKIRLLHAFPEQDIGADPVAGAFFRFGFRTGRAGEFTVGGSEDFRYGYLCRVTVQAVVI